jgi:surface protein
LDNWNVSSARNMINMFSGCVAFNQDLSRWNVSRVRSMVHMFRGCTSLTINPGWQINQETLTSGMFLETPLQGTVLQVAPQQLPQPQAAAQLPQPQLPRGVAFEIHNAFPELNFNKFMDIIRRDNNGASNFKDARYPLEPLITYINNDTNTTIVDTEIERDNGERIQNPEKTNITRDLNGEIKTRLNMYLSEHPETKGSVMEMIQFVMSQGQDYKDPYIRFLTFDCMNAYGPGGASCTKGVFERVFLINKSVLIPLCSDDTSSSAASSAASSSESTCKPVYRELLGCFYAGMDIDALFYEWYDINNMEEGSTSPLANASEEERKEDFRRFVLSKVPRADSTVINKFIAKNENIFKTLITGGRRKRRNRKTKKNKRNTFNKGKRKSLKKGKRKTKRRY